MSNYKTVFFTLGVLQIILGLSMIIPIITQFIFNELDAGFIGSGIVCIIFGILFFLSNLDHNKKLNLQQAFLLTSLSWITIAIFGSLPFVFSSLNLSFTDAFFESMSGITTTGSTIITNLDSTPKAILLWRALLQWLGGIGIIVMAITLMPIMNVGGMQLFKISASHNAEKIFPKSKEISLKLITIYLSLTIICSIFYNIFGMNFFDSVTHSMTTIATGGFSNYNESIGYFDSTLIEFTSIIFIFLGSLPFIAYIKFLNGDKKIFFTDSQIRLFFKITLISIIILIFYLIFKNGNLDETNIISLSFNVISILTGTGYVTEDFSNWGNFSIIFFLVLMFIGGCAGSTTCGIKIFRIQILYQFISNQLKKIVYPRGVFLIKYEKNNIDDKFMSSIISFIYLYIIIFFIITALLSISGLDFVTSISGAATSISNVGPGIGENIGPNGNFSQLSSSSKWILSLGMIMGRLEIFAILILFIPSFWRKY
jgi:trk system potassium uptake protein TrkH